MCAASLPTHSLAGTFATLRRYLEASAHLMRTALILIVILLIAVGGYFMFADRASAPVPESVTTETPTEDETTGSAVTSTASVITYSDAGFTPANMTVSVGDTLRFVNQASRGMWVAVDEHPTHTEYDGTATREHCVDGAALNGVFDQCRQSQPGETWEYTFTKAGTFEYHNHAQSAHGGTITVTE
jgi:plastocyanin